MLFVCVLLFVAFFDVVVHCCVVCGYVWLLLFAVWRRSLFVVRCLLCVACLLLVVVVCGLPLLVFLKKKLFAVC